MKQITRKKLLNFVGLVFLLAIYFYQQSQEGSASRAPTIGEKPSDRKSQPLIYTKHGRCRMSCREISEQDVLDTIENGKINKQKSRPYEKPCPSYAYEGKSDEGERLRIVIGECESSRKVITTINLDQKFHCDCE